jgi:GTP cyclohydrolase II
MFEAIGFERDVSSGRGAGDTVEANHALGFKADCRDFSLPPAILHDLGISRVRVLSNNPRKARALLDAGIEVVAQVRCEGAPTRHSCTEPLFQIYS